MENFYKVLQVPASATQRDIKVAYRKLVQTHHPDINTDAGSEEYIKLINLAYETLSDPIKRSRYDLGIFDTSVSGTTSTPPPPPRRPPPYYYRKAHEEKQTYSTKTQVLAWGATFIIILFVVVGVYAMQYYVSEYYFDEAIMAEQNNELEKAISLYQLAIRDWGARSVDASIKSAELSQRLGAYFYMAEYCRKGLSHSPDSLQTALLFYLEGTAYMHSERFEKAELAFNNSLAYNYNKDTVYEILASIYVNNMGKFNEAEELYTYLLSGNSVNLANYYNRGLCYQNLGRYQQAVEDFKRVLQENPFHGKTLFQLGKAYLALGQKQLACEYLRFSERQGVLIDPDELASVCE
ncbi:MAG: DnaJ domain-containing protein [Cyclobacteriaceae bacterium]|nr:DnaJ domain-containing protein [Cyclobacteriaceae bacterium]